MWWNFRRDYWPAWCWQALETMDALAFKACLKRHAPIPSLREFYDSVYNPGALASDLPDEPVDEPERKIVST